MLNSERKRQVVVLGVFLIPVALVKGTSLFCGVGSPAGASAAINAVQAIDTNVAATNTQRWSTDEKAAAARVTQLYESPFQTTPLYYDTIEDAGENPVASVDPSLPTMIVQAILAGANGSTALINNKAYRVGDVFEETSWSIIAIDNDSHTVTLKNTNTGKTADAAVQIEQ